jgi:hypothetical protein
MLLATKCDEVRCSKMIIETCEVLNESDEYEDEDEFEVRSTKNEERTIEIVRLGRENRIEGNER